MEPTDHLVLPDALAWVEALLTGSLAQAMAIIAFAGIGYAALTGRLSLRVGLRVILGAFILFGAPSIAGALRSTGGQPAHLVITVPAPPPPKLATQAAREAERQQTIDPYAGASIPM